MLVAVDVHVPENLLRLDQAGTAIVADEVRKALSADVLLLEGEITRRAPVGVTANLRGATASEVRGTGVSLTGRVYNPTLYGPPVESGSRPHRPPLANILRWARRVIGGRDATRIGRAVWASIAKVGTKAKPFWAPSFRAMRPKIEARHVAMLARIVARLAGAR